MRIRIPYITMLAAGALTLGGCAYGDVGYGGFGVGYGGGYYDNGYGPYGGYGAYPGYYGGLGYGWYDDFYYPGAGIYVYDSYRRPHRWSDRQRTYWTSRQQAMTNTGVTTRENWSGFRNRTSTATTARSTDWHRRH